MFRAIAALALVSAPALALAPAAQTPAKPAPTTPAVATLSAAAPWWEKVTVTVSGDGEPRSCLYQTSSQPQRASNCDVVGAQAAATSSSNEIGAKDEYTRITFERRFSPGATPMATGLAPGETFLGGQMLALAIGGAGEVKGCRIVAKSGSMLPDYGCKEATSERFAAAGGANAGAEPRAGYMTILVYAHSEHVV